MSLKLSYVLCVIRVMCAGDAMYPSLHKSSYVQCVIRVMCAGDAMYRVPTKTFLYKTLIQYKQPQRSVKCFAAAVFNSGCPVNVILRISCSLRP